MSKKMKDPPNPKPDAWDSWCRGCRKRYVNFYMGPGYSCPNCTDSCPKNQALWGRDWALVAIMAALANTCEEMVIEHCPERSKVARRNSARSLAYELSRKGVDPNIEWLAWHVFSLNTYGASS